MPDDRRQRYYVIRRERDQGFPMWLVREAPAVWGQRDQAIHYRSKGDAARMVDRLCAGTVTIEPTD